MINLQEFILPKKVEFEKEEVSDHYGKFVAEPFERGYGHTIGNSLRRILLSSLEGAAVTAVNSTELSALSTRIANPETAHGKPIVYGTDWPLVKAEPAPSIMKGKHTAPAT